MSSTFPDEEIARLDLALAAGALVLTPNYSSSMQLQNNWCRYALARQDSKVIATPAIYAIDIWLGKLWQELALHIKAQILGWQVLEPAQELLLWRRVIHDTEEGSLLLNIDGTAESTREALRLLRHWQIDLQSLDKHVRRGIEAGAGPDDREIFLQWAKNFIDLCQSKKALTFSDTLHALLELSTSHAEVFTTVLPKQILLWGFTDPPPIYQALFARFAALGISVTAWKTRDSAPVATVVSCARETEEARAAVQWAAAILQANPGAAIGIVCPDMQSLAPMLERMLSQTFGTTMPNRFYSCPVNENLAAHPFVATALQIMELDQDHCDTLVLCQLLRSPWLRGAEEEADARAALELQLRERGELVTSMASFRERCLQAKYPSYSPLLGAILLELTQRKQPGQLRQASAIWMQWWRKQWSVLLDTGRLLATGNSSLLRAWKNLQEQMPGIAFLFDAMTSSVARSLFRRLAQEARLVVTNTGAPIQVTGTVASTGMRFTHLWCMQMTEQHWPGAEQHNPWLPLSLQKAALFPGSTAELVLQKARVLLQQLTASTSHELVFSYAAQMDDTPVRVSTLLPQQLPVIVPALELAALHPAIQLFSHEREMLLDTVALPLPRQLEHSGSGAVLADQAACPFRAFAKHRLRVRQLPKLQYGLTASAIGECIHNALQGFWNVLQSSARLHAADDPELASHIEASVAAALRVTARRYPHTMTPRYQELEHQRLCKLLMDWLQAERSRGHFSVLANEETFAWRFANLTLNLRIDRIDRNEDGSLTVVDYKTGPRSSTSWQEERPEKPQLLLYEAAVDARHQHGPINALLYAHVSIKEQVYAGIGATDLALPGIAFETQKSVSLPSWELLRQHWRNSLEQLAQEYLDGRVSVEPLSRTTCDYCHLSSFCRIAERKLFI